MALVVQEDNSTLSAATSVEEPYIILDALPYVEPLDPNYEQYAVSLIEEEMHRSLGARGPDATGEHRTLERLPPRSGSDGGGSKEDLNVSSKRGLPTFSGRAPMALSEYEVLVARQTCAVEGKQAPDDARKNWLIRADPATDNEEEMDEGVFLTDFETSVATAKVELEEERLRLVNLEMHQHFETSSRWKDYHARMENQFVTPMADAVAQQRMRVDGINAGRMEEQQIAARKLQGLNGRWEGLVTKNHRLRGAIASLEAEVEKEKREQNTQVEEPKH